MAGSNGYSAGDLMAMQKDAIRRVNEMQRIAKEKLEQTSMYYNGNISREDAPSREAGDSPKQRESSLSHPPAPEQSSQPEQHRSLNFPMPPPPQQQETKPLLPFGNAEVIPNIFQGFLEKLNLDSETLLLILMLFLLINEGADATLVMALVYILL